MFQHILADIRYLVPRAALVVLLVAALMIGLGLLGGSSVATPPASPHISHLGEMVRVPGWLIAVTNASPFRTLDGKTALLINIVLGNTSDHPASPPYASLVLTTQEGEREGRAPSPTMAGLPSSLAANMLVQLLLAWYVSRAATRFTLTYADLTIWPLDIGQPTEIRLDPLYPCQVAPQGGATPIA